MQQMQCNFFSRALDSCASVNVLLPDIPCPKEGFRVLYLLHGISDDYSAWGRRSSVERYAEEADVAVVMPSAGRSFYHNLKHGKGKYWDFISQELPAFLQHGFRISQRREDTFVAGLSMGGLGAFKLALHFPERFCAAGSFSGVLDPLGDWVWKNESADFDHEIKDVFGSREELVRDGADLVGMVRAIQNPADYPRFYQACGTEDFLYRDNQTFLSAAKETGLTLAYHEEPGGHSWAFWDSQVKVFLEQYVKPAGK